MVDCRMIGARCGRRLCRYLDHRFHHLYSYFYVLFSCILVFDFDAFMCCVLCLFSSILMCCLFVVDVDFAVCCR